MCRVTILPARVTVPAKPGDTILDAALDHGVEIPHECGGNCACTTCHVLVCMGEETLSPREEAEEERLATAEARCTASRLACQAILRGGDIQVTLVEDG